MQRYLCLVLDHDDTVVRSEETLNYLAFLEALRVLRPGKMISLRDFSLWIFQEGFEQMCANHFGLKDDEFTIQYQIWLDYVMTHIPPAFDGLGPILQRYRQEGGLICVSSHSAQENILRDYETHFGFSPDRVYGWELGAKYRKPNPFALDDIMSRYDLSPRDILVVDDLTTGYQMAKARAVDFAWAGWSGRKIDEIDNYMTAHCTLLFHRIQDLEKFLFES